MKKYTRFIVAIFTFTFIFSCNMVPVFAADFNVSANKGLESATLEAEDATTFYLEDGTKVTIAVVPAISPMDSTQIDSAWASPNSYFSFPCSTSKGNFARWETDNIGDTSMNVTYQFTVPGADPFSSTQKVIPGDRMVAYAETQNGDGLNMNVSITVNAIGASAHYSFYGEQFWSD